MKSYRSPALRIGPSAIHGRGAFAAAPISAGDVVAIRGGSVVEYPEARRRDSQLGGFSMQVEQGFLICPDSLDDVGDVAVFINHSCSPNVGIRGQISFVALRDVEVGEELTFDYAMNISYPYEIDCACGAATCRQRITGHDWQDEQLRTKYSGYWDHVITQAISKEPSTSSPATRGKQPPVTGGAVNDRICYALRGMPHFDLWSDGRIGRDEYTRHLDEILELPSTVPLTENERALSARLHWRAGELVADALAEATRSGVLPSTQCDWRRFERYRDMIERLWDHGGRKTYIFPEEAQLLYAVTELLRPHRIAALGSYGGYWAAWAVAAASEFAEDMILLDTDADACLLTQQNLTKLGLVANTVLRTTEACEFLRSADQPFDMLILDAEGPRDNIPERFRGRAAYGPIAEAALPMLRPGGVLIAHNILLDQVVDHPYFHDLVEQNRVELAEFLGRIGSCRFVLEVPTTAGVGIYSK